MQGQQRVLDDVLDQCLVAETPARDRPGIRQDRLQEGAIGFAVADLCSGEQCFPIPVAVVRQFGLLSICCNLKVCTAEMGDETENEEKP